MTANELYENALANIKDEVLRHQNTVVTLREYGIYNMLQQGVDAKALQDIKVISYRDEFVDYGIVRCSVCLMSFKSGDRLKQYPYCKHICHIKCLELWMSFEAKCPDCHMIYPGKDALMEYQSNL